MIWSIVGWAVIVVAWTGLGVFLGVLVGRYLKNRR